MMPRFICQLADGISPLVRLVGAPVRDPPDAPLTAKCMASEVHPNVLLALTGAMGSVLELSGAAGSWKSPRLGLRDAQGASPPRSSGRGAPRSESSIGGWC